MIRLIIVVFWLAISLFWKLNSKASYFWAVVSILIALALEVTRHPGAALNFIALGYGFMVVGTIFLLKETYYETN